MGKNFHTPWRDSPTPGYKTWSADSLNPTWEEFDEAITYLKNVICSFDGSLSWNKTSGILSWNDTIRIHFNREDGQAILNLIEAGNIAIDDGEFAFVSLNETNNSILTVQKAAISTGAASNFIDLAILVLGYRNASSDNFFPVALRLPLTLAGTIGVGSGSDIILCPEYSGAVLCASGSDNTGAMTSDSEVDSNFRNNYYEWISEEETFQSYDISVQIPIPSDFCGFKSGVDEALTIAIKTEENANTNNKLDITINIDGFAGSSSLSAIYSSVAATWEIFGFDETDSVLEAVQPGDILNILIRLYSKDSKYSRVGRISLKIAGEIIPPIESS